MQSNPPLCLFRMVLPVAMVFVGGTSLHAATLTHGPLAFSMSGISQTSLGVAQFDPALGTLDAVTVTFGGTIGPVSASWDNEIGNGWGFRPQFQGSLLVTGPNLSRSRGGGVLGPNVSLPADNDGSPDFVGSDAFTYANSITIGTTTGSPTDVVGFVGTGTVTLNVANTIDYFPGPTTNGLPSNMHRLNSLGDTTGTIDVSYDYTPVPEPSTLALAAFGVVALAGWRWRRATKKPSSTVAAVGAMFVTLVSATSASAGILASYDFAGGSTSSNDTNVLSTAAAFTPVNGGGISGATETAFVQANDTPVWFTPPTTSQQHFSLLLTLDTPGTQLDLTGGTVDHIVDGGSSGTAPYDSDLILGWRLNGTGSINNLGINSHVVVPVGSGDFAAVINTSLFAFSSIPTISYPDSVELLFFFQDNSSDIDKRSRLDNLEVTGTVVPEPSTLALAAFGVVALGGWHWRWRKA